MLAIPADHLSSEREGEESHGRIFARPAEVKRTPLRYQIFPNSGRELKKNVVNAIALKFERTYRRSRQERAFDAMRGRFILLMFIFVYFNFIFVCVYRHEVSALCQLL